MVEDLQIQFLTGKRMNNLGFYSMSGIIRSIPHALVCPIFLSERCMMVYVEGFLTRYAQVFTMHCGKHRSH